MLTANQQWAGTDDNVFIDIVGKKGRTQKRKLSAKTKNNFERGNLDVFKIEAVDLGELKGIFLYKDGSDEWIVEKVEVDCPNGEIGVFNFANQKVTKKGIKVKNSANVPESKPMIPDRKFATQYRGSLVTKDGSHPSGMSQVSLWVTDVTGKTVGPIEIGQTKDEFNVNLMDELDDLFKIAIRHRTSDLSETSEWNLERIVLQRVSSPTSIQTFNFTASLAPREIYESSADDLAPLTYHVTICTASVKWPTRDNCFINLIGTKVRD